MGARAGRFCETLPTMALEAISFLTQVDDPLFNKWLIRVSRAFLSSKAGQPPRRPLVAGSSQPGQWPQPAECSDLRCCAAAEHEKRLEPRCTAGTYIMLETERIESSR